MKNMYKKITNFVVVAAIAYCSTVSANDLKLSSSAAVVQDATSSTQIFSKNPDTPMPIASMTKLVTAMVILDAELPMQQAVTITDDDVDYLKHSRSRVPVGTVLTRYDLLQLALMSSDNRAAHALARTYPGGVNAAVLAMNQKAQSLQLRNAHFTDPTGLYSTNVASPSDVAGIAAAAYKYDKIREYTTTSEQTFRIQGRPQLFRNTNSLVRSKRWPIELSKTGFIEEAGRCMVIRTTIHDKPFFVVLMDSASSAAREQDARKIKAWVTGDSAMEEEEPTMQRVSLRHHNLAVPRVHHTLTRTHSKKTRAVVVKKAKTKKHTNRV